MLVNTVMLVNIHTCNIHRHYIIIYYSILFLFFCLKYIHFSFIKFFITSTSKLRMYRILRRHSFTFTFMIFYLLFLFLQFFKLSSAKHHIISYQIIYNSNIIYNIFIISSPPPQFYPSEVISQIKVD